MIQDVPFPRVVAHRGLSGLCPENTMPAFGAAVALGVDEIEFDLHMTADGELVACHDDTVDRTSDGSGYIPDLEWDYIAELDAGVWKVAEWAGVRFSRFQDILGKFAGQVVINLHLKTSGPDGACVKRVKELAHKYDVVGSVYIAGSDDKTLADALEIAAEIDRCCLIGQHDRSIVDKAIEYRCARLQFWDPEFDDAMIALAKDNGIICNVFCPRSDTPENARRLYRKGIDAVLTNYANLVIPVCREIRQGRSY